MGARGPIPKPAGRRQRREAPAGQLVALPEPRLDVPAPPRGLLSATRQAWEGFWVSEVAAAVDASSDLPAVLRLFTLLDERERALRVYRRARIVSGSQGQPVLNPMFKALATFDAELRQLEDRFGLTPRGRAALGLTIGQARLTLDELNRTAIEAATSELPDPRLEDVV